MFLLFGKSTLIFITLKLTLKWYLEEAQLPVESEDILNMIT